MKTKIAIGVVVVVLLGGVAYFASKQKSDQQPVVDGDNFHDVVKNHKNSPHYMRALIMLALQGDPVAQTEAIGNIESDSIIHREAAAESLGHFEDEESLNGLKSLLKDKNRTVRIRAIRALGTKPSKAREDVLVTLINKKNISEREKTHMWGAVLKTSERKDLRDLGMRHLTYLVKKAKDPVSGVIASSYIIEHADKVPAAKKALRQVAQSGSHPSSVSNAVRYLAGIKDPVLQKELPKLSIHKSPEVRLAVAETLHRSCPPNRKGFLKRFIASEKEKQVREAIFRNMFFHGADVGSSVLSGALSSGSITKEERSVIKLLQQQLQASNQNDHCS